jgi:hypothetical protein
VLLIVGGQDSTVLDLNRTAAAHLLAPHELLVVPGATHLFDVSALDPPRRRSPSPRSRA